MLTCPACLQKNDQDAITCKACGFDFTDFRVSPDELSKLSSADKKTGPEINESAPESSEVPEEEIFVTPLAAEERKNGFPLFLYAILLIIVAGSGFAWWISKSEKIVLLEDSKEKTVLVEKHAILTVTSDPIGATLYVDDEMVGETPFKNMRLEPSKRILRVEKKYYEPRVETVGLEENKVSHYHAILTRGLGKLTILSQPLGASIFIDGILQDTKTPVTFQEVSAGKRKVLVRMNRFYDSKKIVEVLPDKATTIDIILAGGNLEKYEGKWLEPAEVQVLRRKKEEARKRAEELAANELEKKRLAQKQEAERLAKIREEERRKEEKRLAILREEERRKEKERLAILREARQLEEANVQVVLQELEKEFQEGVSLGELGKTHEALEQILMASRNFKKAEFPKGILEEQRSELQRRISEGIERILVGEFVEVPGGCFQMGCDDWAGPCDSDEKPVHEVCVESFYIGKHEVTQGHWQFLMDYNFSQCQKGEYYPIDNVSWEEVQEFLQKLNMKIDGGFRLPTEAEWEYACRSGGKEEKYCGGNSPIKLAWYEKNSSIGPHQVETLAPNGLGIYDMSGNLWEWCEDRYGEKYYGESPGNDPTGPNVGSHRVVRGGSWGSSALGVRSTFRNHKRPDHNGQFQGFRLVKPAEE